MQSQKKMNVLLAVIATGVMSFSGVLIETATNVTFPTLMKEFSITTNTVQWVTTIYLLVISIFVPISTYFLNNFSRRKLFLAANLLFLLGVILDFLSWNFGILLLGRVFQGIATGISLPLMFQIILTEAPLNRRGVMMGVGTFTTSIAPAIGPSYGGFLTTHFTWHWIFLFLIPLLLLSLVLGLVAIPSEKVIKKTKLDVLGVVLLALTFSGFLIFFGEVGTIRSFVFLLIGIVSLVTFYKTTQKKQAPLLDVKILKNTGFRLLLISFLIFQVLLLGISFILPNFVQVVAGKDASVAGMLMLPGAAVGAIFAPISGRILDRFGAKKPIMVGVAIATAGWLIFTFALGSVSIYLLPVCHIIFQIGQGLAYSNLMTTGLNKLPKSSMNDGNGMFNTLQQFMGAFGTSLVASIIGFVQTKGNLSLVTATALGSKIAMGVLFLLMLISLFCCVKYFYHIEKVSEPK